MRQITPIIKYWNLLCYLLNFDSAWLTIKSSILWLSTLSRYILYYNSHESNNKNYLKKTTNRFQLFHVNQQMQMTSAVCHISVSRITNYQTYHQSIYWIAIRYIHFEIYFRAVVYSNRHVRASHLSLSI